MLTVMALASLSTLQKYGQHLTGCPTPSVAAGCTLRKPLHRRWWGSKHSASHLLHMVAMELLQHLIPKMVQANNIEMHPNVLSGKGGCSQVDFTV